MPKPVRIFLLSVFFLYILLSLPVGIFARNLIEPIPNNNSFPPNTSNTPKIVSKQDDQRRQNIATLIKESLLSYFNSLPKISDILSHPQNTSTLEKIVYNPPETTYSKPVFSFGEILKNKSPIPISPPIDQTKFTPQTQESTQSVTSSKDKARQIKDLLAQLDASYQESLTDFQQNRENSNLISTQTNNSLRDTSTISSSLAQSAYDYALASNIKPTPTPETKLLPEGIIASTPYIPIPTLIAKIHNAVSVPSYTPDDSNQSLIASSLTGNIKDNPIKTTYTIAVLGDSMVDTLGIDLPDLKRLLKESYPKISFALLNYGQGATDLESGLNRLTSSTIYLGKIYPPLLSYKPDILVVESFAYNHWGGQLSDLDRQWLTISRIIDTTLKISPNTRIILAATIAPDAKTMGDGVLNWPPNLKWQGAIITKAYLQNLINFATSQNYPLADSYHPSIDSEGNGDLRFINSGDHLHPSDAGKILFSQKIIDTIKTHHLLD